MELIHKTIDYVFTWKFALTALSVLIIYQFLCYLIRLYRINTQNYITPNSTLLITGGSMGIGREMIKYLLEYYKCTIINIDIREDQFPGLVEMAKEYKAED